MPGQNRFYDEDMEAMRALYRDVFGVEPETQPDAAYRLRQENVGRPLPTDTLADIQAATDRLARQMAAVVPARDEETGSMTRDEAMRRATALGHRMGRWMYRGPGAMYAIAFCQACGQNACVYQEGQPWYPSGLALTGTCQPHSTPVDVAMRSQQ